ncbi:MAG: hypothetical protein RQM92_16600 [Candidatus Syntrophopropionicum ammoniitolerans]
MGQKTVGSITFIVSLVVFFFITNSLALWYVFHQMGYDHNFRFADSAHVKAEVLDLYLEYVAGQGGYKIAVVGDSVVQGPVCQNGSRPLLLTCRKSSGGAIQRPPGCLTLGCPGAPRRSLYDG